MLRIESEYNNKEVRNISVKYIQLYEIIHICTVVVDESEE